MIHTPPSYLKKSITLRLICRHCKLERLTRCRAVGSAIGVHQQVEVICLHCGKMVIK